MHLVDGTQPRDTYLKRERLGRDPFTGLHDWAIEGIPAGDELTVSQFEGGRQPVRRLLQVRKLVERLHPQIYW